MESTNTGAKEACESSAENILFITLDSCRYDSFLRAHAPHLRQVGPLHKALAPSHFTYASHAAFWVGFTPAVVRSCTPWLNPKRAKLFRMVHGPHGRNPDEVFRLEGSNLIEGFKRKGYRTIGSGAVDWFDPTTETGAVLGSPFDQFFFPGNSWSLLRQLDWIQSQLQEIPVGVPSFVFLNVGETHVPYWHEGAEWERWPSPCVPFGGPGCSAEDSQRRQVACLEWVDRMLAPLLLRFSPGTVLVCADHGDCWGEDGLWEHGVSHWATLTVPLLLRVRGIPVSEELDRVGLDIPAA